MLSHQKSFYPLSVWLPANQVGQGYVLYPSWQAFHLRPDGQVELAAAQAPRVAGSRSSRRDDRHSLSQVPRQDQFAHGPECRGRQRAAAQDDEFRRHAVAQQVCRQPRKAGRRISFCWSTTTSPATRTSSSWPTIRPPDKDAIRLLALEWSDPVSSAVAEAAVRLRLLETPGKGLKNPQVRMSYSPYRPSNPEWRRWQPVSGSQLEERPRSRANCDSRFPTRRFGLCRVSRRGLRSRRSDSRATSLEGEIAGCVIDPRPDRHGQLRRQSRPQRFRRRRRHRSRVDAPFGERPAGRRPHGRARPSRRQRGDAARSQTPARPGFAQSLRLPSGAHGRICRRAPIG